MLADMTTATTLTSDLPHLVQSTSCATMLQSFAQHDLFSDGLPSTTSANKRFAGFGRVLRLGLGLGFVLNHFAGRFVRSAEFIKASQNHS